jgi:hypothetical protein
MEIRWQEPNDGGSNITHYTVEWDEGRGNDQFYHLGETEGYTTFEVGIHNSAYYEGGEQYIFRVLATNAVGESEWSIESEAIIAAEVPTKPTQPELVERTREHITIRWSVESDGGSQIRQQ